MNKQLLIFPNKYWIDRIIKNCQEAAKREPKRMKKILSIKEVLK